MSEPTRRFNAVHDDDMPTQVRPVISFGGDPESALRPQQAPQPLVGAPDESDDGGYGIFRRAGGRLSAGARDVAAAVQRGADAASVKARSAVEATSDKLEAVAHEGPSALRSAAEPGLGGTAPTNQYGMPASERRAGVRRVRKARLQLSRIDPWSVMKTTFLFSIAFAVIQFVAVWMIWSVISASGAFDAVNKVLGDLLTSPGSTNTFKLQDYVSSSRVLGLTAVFGVVDVLLITALSTLGSFLYNLAATVLGGLEVTLAED